MENFRLETNVGDDHLQSENNSISIKSRSSCNLERIKSSNILMLTPVSPVTPQPSSFFNQAWTGLDGDNRLVNRVKIPIWA